MAQPTYEWRPPERDWREQDLCELPEDGNRYEIIAGVVNVTEPGPHGAGRAPDTSGRAGGLSPGRRGWRAGRGPG